MFFGLLLVDINDQFGVDGFGKEGLAKTCSLAPTYLHSYPLLYKHYLMKYILEILVKYYRNMNVKTA